MEKNVYKLHCYEKQSKNYNTNSRTNFEKYFFRDFDSDINQFEFKYETLFFI